MWLRCLLREGSRHAEEINEEWFPTLLHARTEIETWRREYIEARSKKILGGLTPAAYAQQLAAKVATISWGARCRLTCCLKKGSSSAMALRLDIAIFVEGVGSGLNFYKSRFQIQVGVIASAAASAALSCTIH